MIFPYLRALNQTIPLSQSAPPPPQRTQSVPACPPQPQQDPFYPSEDMDEGNWEEVEEDGDEEEDLNNWDFQASGKISDPLSEETHQNLPSTSATTESPNLDEELFNMYGLPVNWNLAPELTSWLQSVRNKKVPSNVLKQINQSFVPKEDLQSLFTAPALPLAISRLLFTAPKSLSRGPKILNSSLLRVQKELCVAYKPLLEVINFFYSEAFIFLLDTVPDLKDHLTRQKLLLSQCLAVLISASLKVSKARKHALRPLIKFTSSGILQEQPTSQHVLGSPDLALLSDKAKKEYRALSGVFRIPGQNRSRNRGFQSNYNFQPYNRGYRNYSNSQSRYQGYNNSYQGNNNFQRKQFKPKSKRGHSTPSTSK